MMGKPGQNFGDTIGATILFFVLGQVSVLVFGWIFQLITKYDDQEQCRKGNVAAGIKWASNLVALAIVSSSPIKKTSELASFGVFMSLGGAFLLVLDFVVSYLVIPGNVQQEIVRDRNWGYALIAASILLSTALAVDALLINLPCPGSDAYDKMMAADVVPGEIVTNSTA